MPGSSRVALAWHTAMGNTPFGVTSWCPLASVLVSVGRQLEKILCILRPFPTSAENDQLDLLCCQPQPFADASTPLSGNFSVSIHRRLSARSGALICMHEITWQVRLQFRTKEVTGYIPCALNVAHKKKLSAPHRMREQRGRARGAQRAAQRRGCASPGCTNTLGRSPRKNTRMTLTIKLDRNWSSFLHANSAPPLSVTGSAIAPSARMLGGGWL